MALSTLGIDLEKLDVLFPATTYLTVTPLLTGTETKTLLRYGTCLQLHILLPAA